MNNKEPYKSMYVESTNMNPTASMTEKPYRFGSVVHIWKRSIHKPEWFFVLCWYFVYHTTVATVAITESVDSVCRDGMDMPYVAIQTEAWKTLLKTTIVRLCGYLTFIRLR